MKKAVKIYGVIVFSLFFAVSCGSAGNSKSEVSYEHTCGHCGEGFNGGGYVKDSGGDVLSVSSSEVESFPAHYCSKSCAILD